jgi:hypothetical protein
MLVESNTDMIDLMLQDKAQADTGQSMCEEMNHHYRNCLDFERSHDIFAAITMDSRFKQTLRQL